jgi:beta-phosphoglucomutase-like phosphatase (HAD superfamily)
VIDTFVERLGLSDYIDSRARIGGDMIRRPKPDPEGFLRAARVLGAEPAEALVFEDSRAGLMAAKAAGMRSVFVTCCASDIAGNLPLATASCDDYHALPPRFWDQVADGSADLAGRTFK